MVLFYSFYAFLFVVQCVGCSENLLQTIAARIINMKQSCVPSQSDSHTWQMQITPVEPNAKKQRPKTNGLHANHSSSIKTTETGLRVETNGLFHKN